VGVGVGLAWGHEIRVSFHTSTHPSYSSVNLKTNTPKCNMEHGGIDTICVN
jgi:hypothetical protein